MEKTRYIYEVTDGGKCWRFRGHDGDIGPHWPTDPDHPREDEKAKPGSRGGFRAAIIAMVTDPTCPIWTSSAVTGGEGIDCFVMQNKKRGGGV